MENKMKRDILNHEEIKIGEIEFPDGTSDQYINSVLADYKKAPAEVEISDVTPRQMRQAIILKGLNTNDIVAAINSMPSPNKELAMVEWEYSIAFKRKNPLCIQVGNILGLNSQQMDELWKFAKSL